MHSYALRIGPIIMSIRGSQAATPSWMPAARTEPPIWTAFERRLTAVMGANIVQLCARTVNGLVWDWRVRRLIHRLPASASADERDPGRRRRAVRQPHSAQNWQIWLIAQTNQAAPQPLRFRQGFVSCGSLAAVRSCVTLCSWPCSRSPTNIRRYGRPGMAGQASRRCGQVVPAVEVGAGRGARVMLITPGLAQTPCRRRKCRRRASYQSAWTTVPLCSVTTAALAIQAGTAEDISGQFIVSCQCLARPAGDS